VISGIEVNKQREDKRTGKQLNSIENKGWFPYDCYDRCDRWKKCSAIVTITWKPLLKRSLAIIVKCRLSKKSFVLFNMARSLYGFSAVKLLRSTCGKSMKCCDHYNRWSVVSIWSETIAERFFQWLQPSCGNQPYWWVTLSCHDLLHVEQCCFLDNPGGGAFAFFFNPTPGHLTDLFVPTPGNLPLKKNANAWGLAGGDGHYSNWLMHKWIWIYERSVGNYFTLLRATLKVFCERTISKIVLKHFLLMTKANIFYFQMLFVACETLRKHTW